MLNASAQLQYRRFLLDTFVWDYSIALYGRWRIHRWCSLGKPDPPPYSFKRLVLRQYAQRFGTPIFVETGTFRGDTVYALRKDFQRIVSVEVDEILWRQANARFAAREHISVLRGDSARVLPEVLREISVPCLFWLDGHYSGGITGRGDGETPIMGELSAILAHPVQGHVILIDDARCYTGGDGYPDLNQLRQRIAERRPDWTLSVENDIIRIHAAQAKPQELPLHSRERAGVGGDSLPDEPPTPQPPTEFEITPPKRTVVIDWNELWRYRDLFLVMAWRDFAVRYKQTALGALWAVFQPFITMVVFTFIFNRVAKINSGDGTPYPVFLYIGLLFWQFYSGTLTNAASSMVSNAGLIQKTYFPRLIIPVSCATTGLVDMAVAGLVLVGMMVYYGFRPHLVGVLLLPILVAGVVLVSVGAGLVAAAVNVKYRDVRYALPFLIQLMLYVTPVIYPAKMLDAHPTIRILMMWLNPVSGVITTARSGLLGRTPVDWGALGVSLVMSVFFFVFGLYYFRRTERCFADII